MVPFFPKQIAVRAIAIYFAALTLISVLYFNFAMSWGYFVLGIMWVVGFFLLSCNFSMSWKDVKVAEYLKNLIIVALILRIVWVVASYFYFIRATGMPFEFGAADSLGYHEEATWLAESPWSVAWDYYFGAGATGISDVGYPLYLTFVYKLFGPDVIITRILKACFACQSRLLLRSFNYGKL